MPPVRPALPFSRRPSEPTWSARWRRTPTARHWSRWRPGRRWTYAELNADVNALAAGLLDAGIGKGDRVGIWAPNCAEWTITQYATAKIGAILVNINPAYRTHELAYVLNQSGVQAADLGDGVQDQRLPRDGRRGDRRDRCRAGRLPRQPGVDRPQRERPRRHPPRAAGLPRGEPAHQGRPDQHPVHVRHHRLPQGRDPEPPQHPQQRLLRHRADQPHPRRTDCASRCPSTTASGW